MKWYVTKLVFQIICGEGDHPAQFDEQLCLMEASNEEDALSKATELGLAKEETFYNQKEELVQWKFINFTELYPLSLADGFELCSKISEVDDDVNYKSLVNAKAEQVKQKNAYQLLHLYK